MDKTVIIVDLYKCENDKSRIFYSVYAFWYEILRLDLDEELKGKYLKYVNECLKMNVFYFNSIDYIDYRVFLRRFITLLKASPISKMIMVSSVINEYENVINGITWHYPFVDKINSLDIDFETKASYIMTLWDYIRDLFSSLEYYEFNDEIRLAIMYGIDSVFDNNIEDLHKSLSDRVFVILKKLYLDGKFSLSNGEFDEFINTLNNAERRVWSKYHLSLIACSDNTELIFDDENDLKVFKSVKGKLLKYTDEKEKTM